MFIENRKYNFISAAEKENVLTILTKLVPQLIHGIELIRYSNKGNENLHNLLTSKLSQFPQYYRDVTDQDKRLYLGLTVLKLLNIGCAQSCGITVTNLIRHTYRKTRNENILSLIDKVESMLPLDAA